ncbi:MAG: plasmid recombination protein [Lachnospiraceae bacterium]
MRSTAATIYARQFYEEAYRFGCEIYGEDNIVSAVMHADEINKAVSEELGKPVYHYHLHIVAIPTVRKEILWSKRSKDEALRDGQGGHQPSFPLKEVEEHRSSAGRKRAAGYQQIRKADVPQVLFRSARQALCAYDRSGFHRL